MSTVAISKTKLGKIMRENGYTYEKLEEELGVPVKRFIGRDTPANLASKIFTVFSIDASDVSYYMAWHEKDPKNYVENTLDVKRIKDAIKKNNWSVDSFNAFLNIRIDNYVKNNKSISIVDLDNICWSLKIDRDYALGKSDKINKKAVPLQKKKAGQHWHIKNSFMKYYSHDQIVDLAEKLHVPSYVLSAMKIYMIYVNDEFVDSLLTEVNKVGGNYKVWQVAYDHSLSKENQEYASLPCKHTPYGIDDLKKAADTISNMIDVANETLAAPLKAADPEVEVSGANEEMVLEDIFKAIDKLSSEEIFKIKAYCKVAYKRNKFLEEEGIAL